MDHPINILNAWLAQELQKGAPNPQQAVLSTVSADVTPHARVVAIREITEQGLLFFTQKGTRKVLELQNNSEASLTFWFELYQREVIIEGQVEALSDLENKNYWETYPREAQIRFYSYAPTSSQAIQDKQVLEEKKKELEQEYQNKSLPMSPLYCGFRFNPLRMVFYAYQTDELSDVAEYQLVQSEWRQECLSP